MSGNFIDVSGIDSIDMEFGFDVDNNGDLKPKTTISIHNKNGEIFTKTRKGHASQDLQQEFALIFQLLTENERYIKMMMEED